MRRLKTTQRFCAMVCATLMFWTTPSVTSASDHASVATQAAVSKVMQLVYCLLELSECPPPPCGPGTVYDDTNHRCLVATEACVNGQPQPAMAHSFGISDVIESVYCLLGLAACPADPACHEGTIAGVPPTVCTVDCTIDPCPDHPGQDCQDCAGVPNGPHVTDDCGVCVDMTPPDDKALTLTMSDSHGDGWNGNVLQVGELSFTLDLGTSGQATLSLPAGSHPVTCGGGQWPEEVSWVLVDAGGTEALSGACPFSGTISNVPAANACHDDCGVPYGSNACHDDCGVPNGSNACHDDCGVPYGSNACHDDCGVPNGSNACHDDCGVPNGSNTCHDDCGVPNGNNSSCAPTVSDLSQSVNQSSYVDLILTGDDPNNHPLQFELTDDDGGSAVMLPGNQVVRYTPEPCSGTRTFKYRAYNSLGVYSADATVTMTIYNVAPVVTLSDPSQGTVSHNQDLTRSFTYSDACDPAESLTVIGSHSGDGYLSVSASHGVGTVTWSPLKSTPAQWCNGPNDAHQAQSALVAVLVCDEFLCHEVEFGAQAEMAIECRDICIEGWFGIDGFPLGCYTDVIGPAGCHYCSTIYHSNGVVESSCDQIWSVQGWAVAFLSWWQSTACAGIFGEAACAAPPECWWLEL